MDRIARNSLKKALDLVRAGKYDRARPILIDLLKDHPNLEQGWFLLSYTLPENNRQIYALQQALKINPDYTRARERLAKLREDFEPEEDSVQRAFSAPATETTVQPEAEPAKGKETSPESTRAFFMDDELEGEDSESGDMMGGFDEEEPEAEAAGRGGWGRIILFSLIFVVVVTLAYVFGNDWLQERLSGIDLSQAPAATATEVVSFRELPPTWTPTPAQDATATPEPEADATAAPGAFDLPVPGDDTIAAMEAIEQQLLSVRSLPVTSVDRYYISSGDAAGLLESAYIDADKLEALETESRVLAALGLVPADFSLRDYTISRLADQASGVYIPAEKSILLFNSDFSGLAPFLYAHEYEHALTGATYDLSANLGEGNCSVLSDACRAGLALIEGDAAYASTQWLAAFGEADTIEASDNYDYGAMLAQNGEPPAFVRADLAFSYQAGLAFAQSLVDASGVQTLDAAFNNPPSTTEQILHPDKYLANEGAAALEAVDLAPALGESWQPLASTSLGEWLTYLMLGQGADENARLDDTVASTAAAGWGADQLQVYTDADGRLLLAAHYLWDSEADAAEWQEAMQSYLAAHLAALASDFEGGQCYQTEQVASCVFLAGSETLWLHAPNTETVGQLLALYAAWQ